MNRELKFRVWLHDTKEWGNVSCIEVFNSTGKLEYLYQDQPYTIQQYTGLKDSKGVEIYEGDIIFNDEDKEIVRWGFCSWLCGNESFADLDMRFVKIIGNVFENQEKEQA
jgi:hypothetical protein